MRVGFIRKVLGIVSCQLLFSLSLVLYAAFSPSFEVFIKNPFIAIMAFFLCIVPLMSLLCCNLTRIVPINYMLLFLFTLGESILVSYVSSLYTLESVLLAIVLFALTTVCLWTASLCMTSIDQYVPTMIGSLCFALLLQLVAVPIYLMSAGANYDAYLVMEGIGGSIIYGIYVIIDLKMIQEKISVDDYILGAITLYVDLITLFVKILQVVGKRK